MSNFDSAYVGYIEAVEDQLSLYMDSLVGDDNPLVEAMRYSLMAGGKRVRPVLMLAAADMLGVDRSRALPFAMAIEMIHTYSLIHDDLPAMDNDDFRRGKPSCHKKYGEGQAILAGDALLNEAYALCFSAANTPDSLKAAAAICEAAGVRGMVGGQSSDLKCERSEIISEMDLKFIIENKTAKLIKAPLTAASMLAGGRYLKELGEFGESLGLLFQVTDDILDVESTSDALGKTVGKDEQSNKLTCVRFYGLNGAKEYAAKLYEKAVKAIETLPNNEFLLEFAAKIYKRKH